MTIEFLSDLFTVCKIPHNTPIPAGDFVFFSRTDCEDSLVCPTDTAPPSTIAREDGWCGMRIIGPLDFSLIGILARISAVLAEAEIGIFAVSTYDTDYIFIKEENRTKAMTALAAAGYTLR